MKQEIKEMYKWFLLGNTKLIKENNTLYYTMTQREILEDKYPIDEFILKHHNL